MQTRPCGTIRFSFFLRNSFFRFVGFAAAPGAAAASLGSFAIFNQAFQDAGLKSPALRLSLNSAPKTFVSRHELAHQAAPYLRAIVFFFAATAPFRGPLR